MTGVYLIRCIENGKIYVGSAAVSITKRWLDHKWLLRQSKHPNRHLQAAWKRYGENNFEFVVLEECEPDRCTSREQKWIDELQPIDRSIGYNSRPKAESNLGLKHTEQSRANMSAALRQRSRRKETYDKIAAALKGRKLSPDVCVNMSTGQAGKKHSEATKIKMSATRKGRKYSEDHRKAIAEGVRKSGTRKPNASGQKGVQVEQMPSGNIRYRAVISVNGKRINLGSFQTANEAELAYRSASRQYFGEA